MRIEGFKCIGRIGDEYIFADSVFEHNDGFQGVTGSRVRPVSAEEYEWANDPENVAERYEDVWRDCVGNGNETRSLDDFVADALRYDGVEQIMFDESDCCDAGAFFDEQGIEYECTDCSGGGRMFGGQGIASANQFDEVFDRPALDAILDLEDGDGSTDDAAWALFGRPMVSILDDFDAWFDRAARKHFG